jgi:phage shock protein C
LKGKKEMTNTVSLTQMQWVRSKDGILAGVCEGLAKQLDINPWLLRAGWLTAVLFFGTGILFYVILAFSMPREDRLHEAHNKRFLGVCARIARKTELDIGLVRSLAVILGLFSFGATMVGYIVLYFVLPQEENVIDIRRIDKTSAIRL